jgi:hypothetical protein
MAPDVVISGGSARVRRLSSEKVIEALLICCSALAVGQAADTEIAVDAS